MTRFLSPVSVLLFLFLFPAVLINASPLSATELTIAFSNDIPPFIMKNGSEGLEVDIVREALKFRGHTFKVKQCSYKRLEVAVSQMGLDGAAAVREQNDGTFYSDTFISFDNVAVTKKKANIDLNSISDLKNRSIVTRQNAHKNLGSEFASLFAPENNLSFREKYYEIPVQENQVKMFWLGRGDVVIIDKAIFRWLTNQVKEEITISDDPVYHELFPAPTQFQVNFKSKKIRDDFNAGLRYMQESGTYQNIFKRYFN